MNERGKEIEAKFYLHDLSPVLQHLQAQGGSLLSDRHLERNLSFDTPDGRLKAAHEVLRLRQDDQTRLTFKRRLGKPEERIEIEILVEDLERGRALLETLGYQVVATYEKHRQTYAFGPVQVMLDELPFGNFVEIEGASIADIRQASISLGLDWERRIADTYLALFDRLRHKLQLPTSEATFETFADRAPVTAEDLGVAEALISEAPAKSEP